MRQVILDRTVVKEYFIKTGLLDRTRKLTLREDVIEWENGDVKGDEFVQLQRSEITDFRHGMDWTVWYKFVVGRKFSLGIKGSHNKEVKIQFSSLFGQRKKYLQMYSDIVDDIWRLYYLEFVDRLQNRLNQDGIVSVGSLRLSNEGVEIADGKILPWRNVAMKEYDSYFALYDINNATKYRSFRYDEYGTEAVWSLVRRRLQ